MIIFKKKLITIKERIELGGCLKTVLHLLRVTNESIVLIHNNYRPPTAQLVHHEELAIFENAEKTTNSIYD